jgi:hypothetical protein
MASKRKSVLQETHDTVISMSTSLRHVWQAVMGLYAVWGSILVGAVVTHALSK